MVTQSQNTSPSKELIIYFIYFLYRGYSGYVYINYKYLEYTIKYVSSKTVRHDKRSGHNLINILIKLCKDI